ncbi:ABC transporter substrate-binding protein [Natronomonas sp.]|uniref:ABC transporter substrate-binding protein n=1 Tax=Natronomonas sp. TaxID=2184060 RepID=UPI0026119D36|nr:ABC transporter substrate-binding protein [Natronomonas sp.]
MTGSNTERQARLSRRRAIAALGAGATTALAGCGGNGNGGGGGGGTLLTPEGDQVVLDVYHNSASETQQLVAEFIGQELSANLGIEVEIEPIDGVRFNDEYWTAEAEGGSDTVGGETVEWSEPTPRNPGPRSVTSNEAWDMSLVIGLNTYPLNPQTNRVFFDGANSRYNPVGYYPEFDAAGLFEEAGAATTESEIASVFEEIFVNIAAEQPYIMLTFTDSITGYNPELRGPVEEFSNGWDFAGWFTEAGGADESAGLPEDIEEPPAVEGSYNSVSGSAFSTLNPLYNTESGAGTAIDRALDQGYTFDENQEYFPLLYDMSTDRGEVWVFEVRDGLRFSDPYGSVDAETFVYLIEELHQSEWANTANAIEWSGVNVEVTGDLEFQAELPEPRLLWPESFDPLEYPIPRGLLEPYVENEDREGLQRNEELLELAFTGNLGPYVLEEWNRGSGTTYTRNDEYYLRNIEEGPALFENAPYFEESTIEVIESQASRLGALETGEADSAGIPPERFEDFDENPDVSVYQVPQSFNRILSVNMRDNGWSAGPGNLFQFVEFRRAMASAIGKTELIEGVYRGLAQPHYTWQPRFSDFYPGDDVVETYGTGDLYGPDVAREFARAAIERSEFDYRYAEE